MPSTEYLTPAQVAAIEPPVHVNTVYNWMLLGCDGVRLEYRKRGGRYFTTQAWLDEFDQRRREKDLGPKAAAKQTGARERKLLEAMGVQVGIG